MASIIFWTFFVGYHDLLLEVKFYMGVIKKERKKNIAAMNTRFLSKVSLSGLLSKFFLIGC